MFVVTARANIEITAVIGHGYVMSLRSDAFTVSIVSSGEILMSELDPEKWFQRTSKGYAVGMPVVVWIPIAVVAISILFYGLIYAWQWAVAALIVVAIALLVAWRYGTFRAVYEEDEF